MCEGLSPPLEVSEQKPWRQLAHSTYKAPTGPRIQSTPNSKIRTPIRYPNFGNPAYILQRPAKDERDSVNPFRGGGAAYWGESTPAVVQACAFFKTPKP